MVNATGSTSDRSPGSLSTTASSQGSSPRFALSERGAPAWHSREDARVTKGLKKDGFNMSVAHLQSFNTRFWYHFLSNHGLQLHKMI